MSQYKITATAAFGLESVVARELKNLGYKNLTTENGRVSFTGDKTDIARCNIWLRCADRVLIELASFSAKDFEELFQGTKSVEWEKFLPEDAFIHVKGKSIKSTLHSVPGCQSIVKKAIIESMKRKYNRETFPEDGERYRIEIALLKDSASLTVDTSGEGLHKRGYRTKAGEAPLRETLAAAIVLLSRWGPERVLADPLCGSGTIPIEAALIGRNIAPGLRRSFASESWKEVPSHIWKKLRREAEDAMNYREMTILGSDMDKRSIQAAMDNAERAGVGDGVTFQKKSLAEFSSKKKYGCVITNPPYGVRVDAGEGAGGLSRELGEVLGRLDNWSCFIITPDEEFEKHFGKKSDKNRKLYNGKIKCWLHHYFGELPPRPRR
jgi:putative N6-adenine-specific DNA methylase